jgi:hypothetical protein
MSDAFTLIKAVPVDRARVWRALSVKFAGSEKERPAQGRIWRAPKDAAHNGPPYRTEIANLAPSA